MPALTILWVKEHLANISDMPLADQSMFLIGDKRQSVEDFELQNCESISQVAQYAAAPMTELRLAVLMRSLNNVADFIRALPPSATPELTIGDMTEGNEDHQLNWPLGIAFVPAHPELVVVTAFRGNQVRVYRQHTMLCMIGREDGYLGEGGGEFESPFGVVVTTDSKFVVVTEFNNHRAQVLRLVVADDASTAKLEFVRFIGREENNLWPTPNGPTKGQMWYPKGVTMRLVGKHETVLVAEGQNFWVSEFELDGTFIRTIGSGKLGSSDGDLNDPADVTVLPSGDVAVTEDGNHRVSIFDGETGVFLRKFGTEGRADGEFSTPCAITSDAHGNLLVLDRDTNRLQAFDMEGTHLCTRSDLVSINQSGFKGVAWSPGSGCIAIANSDQANALAFAAL
jgi:DNA-binding beta-propeller fold protein YncE